MKKTSKALASTAALCLVLSTSSVFAAENTAVAPERLSGANRVDTAVKIAEKSFNEAWKGQGNAILSAAADANLVDSLAVAPLSYQLKAPILLNDAKDSINADTLKALKANNVKTVYIATGEGVISNKAKAQLEKEGFKVERLGGKNRYETAKNILDTFKKNGGDTKNVALVSGNGLADALSVAPEAARKGMPILLTDGKDAVAANLAEVAKAADTVYAIGGNGIISDALVQQLKADRVSGHSRYETNAAVIKKFAGDKEFGKIYLGNGQDGHLVDSLTGSVLAAQSGSPIVLADKNLADATKDALKGKVSDQTGVVALGGEAVVSNDLIKEVTNIATESSPEYVAALKAVKAYEDAKIETVEEIVAAKALKVPADKAVELIKDQAQKDALKARIAAKDKAIEEAEAKLQLKVESVGAINASELVVNFSKDVDETTAENKINYQLKVNDNNVDSSKILDVKVNGKKATILLDSDAYFQSGDKYVIQTNDAIKSVDGKRAEKFVSEEKTFNESVAPTLKAVKTTANALELEFDRPVVSSTATDLTLIKIDGIAIGSQDLKPVVSKSGSADILGEAGNYKYTVSLTPDELKAATEKGNHEVVIYDVKDTAKAYPKVASVLTGSYTINDEVTTPEVTGIESVNANKFFLYTNTPVALDKAKVIVEKGNHEFATSITITDNTIDAPTGKTAKDTFVDAFAGTYTKNGVTKNGVWVVVTDDQDGNDENPLYKSGETTANLKVTLENFTANGLVGKKSVQNVTLNKNNTKPAIKETSIDKANRNLIVTFDNAIEGNITANDIVVRDKDNIVINPTNVNLAGDKVTITLNKVDDAPYTVEFKADKFKNVENKTTVSEYLVNTLKNDKLVATVASQDTNFKYTQFAFKAGQPVVTDNQIEFSYDVDMSDSARNVANYTLDGKVLPAGSTVDFVGDRKTVRVTLPKGTLKASTQYKFGISTNVATEAGSYIVGSLQTKAPAEAVIELTDNIAPELKSAQYLIADEEVKPATMTKKIEVTFNEKLADVDEANAKNDFKVVVNGSTINVNKVEDGTKKDEKVVLTLSQEVNVNQEATISIIPEAEQKGTEDEKKIAIKDIAGNKASTEKTTKSNTSKYSTEYAKEIEAAKTVAAVDIKIEALPSVESLKLANDAAVTEANNAYNALTAEQKALVKYENSTKLTNLVSKMADMKTPAAAPAAVADTGKITGVDTTMEYQKVGETTWNKCTGTEIIGTAGEKYIVRIAATDIKVASAVTAELVIQ
ncbi:cell wall-binding repeat-containing protein [Clostridium sporogenes]|uniref:cell wall-binding repeat-containing protein n=1 Tax=Clostridium sporogenes TaxID=1509 RepID=UPI0006B270BA|nr:cell wall-binding repeat-containing protein [Clostridium sporogenes]KOY64767.1 hypothetical protein AN649_16865 [Clostridium sporogenes]